MAIFKQLRKWSDERIALANANERLEELWSEFVHKQVDRDERRISPEAWESYTSYWFAEYSVIQADIAKVETDRAIKRAGQWEVPFPQKPYGTDEDTEHWKWHPVHATHYLSDEGKMRLRREVYLEMDIRSRPLLTWAALIISVVSLAVSALAP